MTVRRPTGPIPPSTDAAGQTAGARAASAGAREPGARGFAGQEPRGHEAEGGMEDAGTRGVPAQTAARAPNPDRGVRLAAASRALAIASAQLLLVAGAAVVVGWILAQLWVVLLPVFFGLLFTTILWPPARFLRAHRWPPALAALVVLVGFLCLLGGILAVIVPQIGGQAGELATGVTQGLGQLRDWLRGPPLNLGQDQIGNAVDEAVAALQNNASNIASYALTGLTTVGGLVLNLVLAVVLSFFFLKDGPRWTPWLAAQTGHRAAPHVAELSRRAWDALAEFVRLQALVGLIDAVFIGLGLFVVGVPLVIPLAVITFFGAFVPIIGAFVAGGFAVLIALVSNGFTAALIVLGIVIAVQQLEGNVLQPILQGRGLNLHAAVVILAVTAGGGLLGIVGAFLAVPVAALVAVAYRYGRDVLDGRHPEVADDGTITTIDQDDAGARLVRAPAETGEDTTEDGAAHQATPDRGRGRSSPE